MKFRGSFHRWTWFASAVVALALLSVSGAWAVPPAAPTGLQAGTAINSGGGPNVANLWWTSNTESDLKSYVVYRTTSTSGVVANSTWTVAITTIAIQGTTTVESGLTPEATYYYALLAKNTADEGSSLSVTMSTKPALGAVDPAPAGPTTVAASDSPADQGFTLNLSWSGSISPDIKDYRIFRATFTSVFVSDKKTLATIASPGSTHQDGGLTNGATYYYQILGRDNALNGSFATVEFSSIPVDNLPPAAPTGLTVVDPGTTVLNLFWTANTEADRKDYRIYRSTSAGVTQVSSHVVTAVVDPGTTHQDANVVVGTEYHYKLAARDVSLNESGLSAEASGTVGAPAAPTGLGVGDPGTTVLNLSWTANTEPDRKDYRIFRSTNAGVTLVSSHVVTAIVSPGTTHQDANVVVGTRYNYKATARDTSLNESGGAGEVSSVPGAPAAPTGLGAADVPSDQGFTLQLSWTANTESDRKDYRVYRSTNAGVTQVSSHVVTAVASPGTTHQDGGLSNGTTYYYRLTTRDTSLNESAISATDVGTYPVDNLAPVAPAGLGIVDPGTTVLNMTWTANTEPDLKDYVVFRSTNIGVTQVSSHSVAAVASPGTTNQNGDVVVGTRYNYRISARDTSGNQSGLSAEVFGVPGTPSAPASPGVAHPGQGDRLNLSWSFVTEADLKDYRIRRSTGAGITAGTFVLATVAGPGTTHQDGTVVSDTTYYYRITARDTGLNESALSVEVSSNTLVPPVAVGNLAAAQTANEGEITLTWTAPGDDGTVGTAQNYQIRLATVNVVDANFDSTGSGLMRDVTGYLKTGTTVPLAPNTVTSLTLSDLVPGVTYYFALKTMDEVGITNRSTLSNVPFISPLRTLSVSVTSQIPIIDTADPAYAHQVRWTWSDRVGESGYGLHDVAHSTPPGVPVFLAKNTTFYTESSLIANTLYTRHVNATYPDSFWGPLSTDTVANVSTRTLADIPGVSITTGAAPSSTTVIGFMWTGNGSSYRVEHSTPGGMFQQTTDYYVPVGYVTFATFTHTALLPDTTYTYRAFSRNADGALNGTPSVNVSTRTFPAAPDALRTVGKSTGAVTWAWSDNATSETGYYVLTTTVSGGGSGILISSNVGLGAPGNAVSKAALVAWMETGLSPNQQYTRRVRAVNNNGVTAAGEFSTFFTDSIQIISSYTLPSPPINLTNTAVTQNSASLSWDPGTGGAARYKVERASDVSGAPGTWATVMDWVNALTGTAFTDTGLTVAAAYWYRVSAFNPDKDAGSATNPLRVQLGVQPPTAFAGSADSTSAITWSWTDNATTEDGYRVHASTGGDGIVSPDLAPNTTFWQETGLSVNTSYSRHANAFTTLGHSDSNSDTKWTLANVPAAPTLSVITPTAITVNWVAPAGGAGSYRLDRSTDLGFGSSTTAAGASAGTQTALTYGDSGLASNTTYYYRVLSYNGGGVLNPAPSASLTTRTLPAAATPGATSGVTTSTITWNWANPATGADAYQVLATTGGSGTVSVALSSMTTTYTEGGVTPLTPNTSYSRSVQASNIWGVSNSATMTQVTLASIPSGLTGLAPSSMTVTLSWTAGDASRYQVETATDTGGVWATTATILSPGTTHQAAGLNPDTKYWFRLKSINSALAVNPTPSATALVVTRPGPPTGFAGVVQSVSAITWSWTDTTTNETQFEVRRDTDDSLLTTLSPNTTTWTESSLSPNAAYGRHVHAVVPSGEGLASNSDTRTTYASTPTVPSSFTLIGTSSLTATWAAGAGGAGSYKVERSTDAGFGSVTTATGASAGAQTAVSFADSGLAANTTYYYRVYAYNTAGNLNPTPGGFGTTRTLPAAATPAAPGVNSPTSISWSWANPGTGADSATVIASTGGTVSVALAATATTYTENALSPNSPYTRQVRETNNTGTTDSVNMTTTTTLAAGPSGLTVLAVSSNTVTLSWAAPSPGGAGSYRLDRALDSAGSPGPWATIQGFASGVVTGTMANDIALSTDTKYWYRVYAYNSAGAINLAASTSAQATTLAATASTLSTTTVTISAITWTWTDVTNSEAGFLLESATHAVIADLAANATVFVETGLAPNTGYARHVHAKIALGTQGGSESPTSNELTIYTRAGSPTALAGAAVGDGKVALSWTAPANGAYKYRVERAPAVGGTYAIMARVLGAGTTHQDVTPSPGTYAYRVIAENAQALDSPAATNEVSVEVAGPVTVAVAPTSTATVTVVGSDTGTVKTAIEILPGAFPVAVSVSIATAPPASASPAASLADAAARLRGDTKVKVDDDLSDTVRELTARDDAGRLVQPVKGIKFTIPFNVKKVKSYMVKALKICRLNETSGEWEVAEGDNKSDDTTGSVTTTITHFSVFRLAYAFSPAPALTEDRVKVFPNPLDLTKGAVRGAVKFDGLTAGSVVEVYDIAGDLVARMEPGFARGGSVNSAPVNGRAEWDGHDTEGNVVVRGLYLYRILDPGKGSVSGKFAVITK